MIISASRRTDIPAFYSEWFFNRIKAGYCTVPNPFNAHQISYIDLNPDTIDAIVFWTRNAHQMLNNLSILNKLNIKYYFQYTINNFPKKLEPNSPGVEGAINTFKNLVNTIGIGRAIWRYDPILLTSEMDLLFHEQNFEFIAKQLKGYTKRVVISIVDDYQKTLRRVKNVDSSYISDLAEKPHITGLLKTISEIAIANNFEIQSCAEKIDFSGLGIKPGKCIDDSILKDELGIELSIKKDKSQRKECGCVISKDIGMNNTCIIGCEYCYATISQKVALENFKSHNPDSPSLLGWHEAEKKSDPQLGLF